MPARSNAEKTLGAALAAVRGVLAGARPGKARVPWMVIGGAAMIVRGVRRMTTDVDVVVRGDAVELGALVAELAVAKIVPRIADAIAFAETNLVLLLRHEPSKVEIDLSLAWSAFEHEALAAATPAKLGSVRAPFATADALVVFKAIAGRPKDLDDAAALLALHADIDLASVRRRVAEVAALAEEEGMNENLEAAIRRARLAVL